ncbi:MAG: hypothetical protein AAGA93_03075 [Actinomycetota bacterium]
MTTVSLVSFSGAPGTTTVALATAAALTTTGVPEPVLVELATSGGVVAGWYDLPAEPGLSSLALAIGPETPDVLAHAQELPGGLPAVVAPPSGSRVLKVLGARAAALASYLQQLDATVVADCGRVAVDTPLRPVLEASSLIGVVVRPTREDFRLAATGLAELNTVASGPLPAGWVLIGESPWSVDEIIAQYGLPVLATVADDRPGAEAVAGRRRLRRHSPLSRSVQSFADDVTKHLRVASADDPLGYLRSPPTGSAAPTQVATTPPAAPPATSPAPSSDPPATDVSGEPEIDDDGGPAPNGSTADDLAAEAGVPDPPAEPEPQPVTAEEGR